MNPAQALRLAVPEFDHQPALAPQPGRGFDREPPVVIQPVGPPVQREPRFGQNFFVQPGYNAGRNIRGVGNYQVERPAGIFNGGDRQELHPACKA